MRKADKKPAQRQGAEGARDPNEDDVGLVEYPLLEEGTSLMHYAVAATSPDDFPEFVGRMAKYQKWAERGFDRPRSAMMNSTPETR